MTKQREIHWEQGEYKDDWQALAANGQRLASVRLRPRELAPGEWRLNVELESAELDPAIVADCLDWCDSAAKAITPAGVAVTLALDFEVDSAPAYRELLPGLGFELSVAEDEYRRPLAGIPSANLAAQLTDAPWHEHSAPLFFHAYDSAFRERPGFPGWDEARWRRGFENAPEFRPDLSRVVLDGGEPAAFAVLWVEDDVGWIIQIGVRPDWRGQGVGEALLGHALTSFAAEGLSAAALNVATNNPRARALYERVGFRRMGGYESWRKGARRS